MFYLFTVFIFKFWCIDNSLRYVPLFCIVFCFVVFFQEPIYCISSRTRLALTEHRASYR